MTRRVENSPNNGILVHVSESKIQKPMSTPRAKSGKNTRQTRTRQAATSPNGREPNTICVHTAGNGIASTHPRIHQPSTTIATLNKLLPHFLLKAEPSLILSYFVLYHLHS
jgi:hypothetical protein